MEREGAIPSRSFSVAGVVAGVVLTKYTGISLSVHYGPDGAHGRPVFVDEFVIALR